MSAKEIVLEKFRGAEAKFHKAISQHGQTAEFQTAYWAVYAAPGIGQPVLGEGPTEQAAWTNASSKVLKDLRKARVLRITRQALNDAKMTGDETLVRESLEQARASDQEVVIVEIDGSETPFEW